MAQECGFFNAQLDGDEFDRVYLAEQFAAYFAAFIGNGIYGKSMQKLQVLCQDIPNMSIKVLSGEAYINGWWYRNKDTHNIQIPIADGVLSRIDTLVLRWGSVERDIWLHLITGVPSTNPVKPNIRRDADYYDLQLAVISVSAGIISITQAQIQDTRLDNSVCGLVTGVVDQIDTTNLYNQFEAYFKEFKETYEADYDQWTAEQKQAYIDYITAKKEDYDKFVSDAEQDYTEYTQGKKDAYDEFVTESENNYNEWTEGKQAEYTEWYDIHTLAWSQEFTNWFNSIKDKLSEDVAGSLQLQIDEITERLSRLEDMVFTGVLEAPVATNDGKLIAMADGNVIDVSWNSFPDVIEKNELINILNGKANCGVLDREQQLDEITYGNYIGYLNLTGVKSWWLIVCGRFAGTGLQIAYNLIDNFFILKRYIASNVWGMWERYDYIFSQQIPMTISTQVTPRYQDVPGIPNTKDIPAYAVIFGSNIGSVSIDTQTIVINTHNVNADSVDILVTFIFSNLPKEILNYDILVDVTAYGYKDNEIKSIAFASTIQKLQMKNNANKDVLMSINSLLLSNELLGMNDILFSIKIQPFRIQ